MKTALLGARLSIAYYTHYIKFLKASFTIESILI